MKKGLRWSRNVLWLVTMAVAMTFTACDTDDDYWWGDGWGNYRDPRLSGYWELVQYNSDPVDAGDANYLYFNGNGRGYYYYLDRGRRYVDPLYYSCQNSVSGASNYQINLQYGNGSPVTSSYWFTHGNNTLWLQWQTAGGRVQTYVYDRIPGAPW